MQRSNKLPVYGLVLIGLSLSLFPQARDILDPTEEFAGSKSTVFMGNPYEDEERKERIEAYHELFESDPELRERIGQNILYREVFTPRISDQAFGTELAANYRKGTWRLKFNPQFGDFFNKNSIRMPLGVTYNFSRYFEMFAETGTFFPNPFGDLGDDLNVIRGDEKSAGFYNFRWGGKYSWVRDGVHQTNVAVGFIADMPSGEAPLEITDSYARYEPYVTFSRQFKGFDNTLAYLNLTYQFVEQTPFDPNPVDPRPRDRIFVKPGFIYYPGGKFRYSLEVEYRTNALDFRHVSDGFPLPPGYEPGDDIPPGFRPENWVLAFTTVHEVILKPGITWFPKKETREGLWIPGNWDVGVVFDVPLIEKTGESFGASVRFRWFYDYRQLILKDLPEMFQRSPFSNNGKNGN